MTFEEQVQETIRQTIIKQIQSAELLRVEYNAKLNISSAQIRQMYDSIDMTAVLARVKTRVEEKIADGIINSLQTEVANDVKSIMCNRELREDLRSVIRSKIRECESKLKE